MAECQLDEEDTEAALSSAWQALDAFQSAGDSRATADTLRLIVHALCARADQLHFDSEPYDGTKVQAILDSAAKLVDDHISIFTRQGDQRGLSCMLLSCAEVALDTKRSQSDEKSQAGHNFSHDASRVTSTVSSMFVRCLDRQESGMLVKTFRCPEAFKDAWVSVNTALRLLEHVTDHKLSAIALSTLCVLQLRQRSPKDAMTQAMGALALYKDGPRLLTRDSRALWSSMHRAV